MQDRLDMIEEQADGEQVELDLINLPPDIFLSDSSQESEIRQDAAETPPAEPVSSAETPPLTLAQQLRAASLQAALLEAVILRSQNRMSVAELNIWILNNEKGRLSDKLAELELDMSLQTFDLYIHKELSEYQEITRQSLTDQLRFVTAELSSTLSKLNEAQNTVIKLLAQVSAYQVHDQEWH